MKRPVFLSSKMLFIVFLITIAVISFTVFLTGLDIRRSIYENTLITLTIISVCFFCFLVYGLYYGFRMKETVGNLTKKIQFMESTSPSANFDIPVVGDDEIESMIAGALLWILASILFVLFLFFFETILWACAMIIGAALYWVFYRATKLVLKRAGTCKGDIFSSVKTSLTYTFIYSGWIYLIVAGLHCWKK